MKKIITFSCVFCFLSAVTTFGQVLENDTLTPAAEYHEGVQNTNYPDAYDSIPDSGQLGSKLDVQELEYEEGVQSGQSSGPDSSDVEGENPETDSSAFMSVEGRRDD